MHSEQEEGELGVGEAARMAYIYIYIYVNIYTEIYERAHLECPLT